MSTRGLARGDVEVVYAGRKRVSKTEVGTRGQK